MLSEPPAHIRLIINGTEYQVRSDGQSEDFPSLPAGNRRLVGRPMPTPPQSGHPLKWRDGEPVCPGMPQLPHQFAFSRRTALVSVDVVRAVLGVDAITVGTMVDAGELAWVFDVSATKSGKRELRFWTRTLPHVSHPCSANDHG